MVIIHWTFVQLFENSGSLPNPHGIHPISKDIVDIDPLKFPVGATENLYSRRRRRRKGKFISIVPTYCKSFA